MKYLLVGVCLSLLLGCVRYDWEAKDLAKEALRKIERLEERLEHLEEKVYTEEHS